MPRHHSNDYKHAVVQYYLSNHSDLRKTCEVFKCSHVSLMRWTKRYQRDGTVAPKAHNMPSIKITPEIKRFIIKTVKDNNTITLWDLAELVLHDFDIHVSASTIYRVLEKHRISRKRVRMKYYPEKGISRKDALKQYYQQLQDVSPRKIISLDETAIYLNMKPIYGRNERGKRVVIETHDYPFKKFNMICAIRHNKVIGWILYEDLKGGVKKEDLVAFIHRFIANKYKGNTILMDNASFHRSKEVKEAIQATGNKLLYCVRYNPQTNPIEEMFSQLKHYLRKKSPTTYKECHDTITEIIATKIKNEHLLNYIRHTYQYGNVMPKGKL